MWRVVHAPKQPRLAVPTLCVQRNSQSIQPSKSKKDREFTLIHSCFIFFLLLNQYTIKCINGAYYLFIILRLLIFFVHSAFFPFSFPFRFWLRMPVQVHTVSHTHTQNRHNRRRLMCIIRIFGYRFLIAIKHDDRILLLRHSVHATCATTFIQCVCIVDKRRRARARTLVRAYTMNSRHTYSKLMHFYCGIFAFLLALISIHQRHKVIGGYIHNHKCNYYYLLLITKYIV